MFAETSIYIAEIKYKDLVVFPPSDTYRNILENMEM